MDHLNKLSKAGSDSLRRCWKSTTQDRTALDHLFGLATVSTSALILASFRSNFLMSLTDGFVFILMAKNKPRKRLHLYPSTHISHCSSHQSFRGPNKVFTIHLLYFLDHQGLGATVGERYQVVKDE
jgi:hypothetical protein